MVVELKTYWFCTILLLTQVLIGLARLVVEPWNDLSERLKEMDNFLLEKSLPKLLEIFQRNGHHPQSDLEVVLSSGPLFSPDVIFNTLKIQTSTLNLSLADISGESGNALHQVQSIFGPNEPDIDEFTLFSRNSQEEPDYIKINATSGGFSFNFSQDARILVVSPQPHSRLVLTCNEMDLRNCSTTADTLVVNNVGDLNFRRNTFIYCGPKVQVRVVSIRRKISLRIRRDERVTGEMECSFVARMPRFLEDEEGGCGKLGESRSSKIIGGRRIAPGLFPYLVQLDMTKSSGIHTTCSGTLIHKSWVLTAAHCLRGVEAISVFLGGTDRTEFTENELLVQADKFILHKDWNSRTLLGDIALVKLSKAIKFTDEISPVCLPDRKLRNENLQGKKGVAAGWGRVSTTEKAPRQAYRVKLPFLSDLRCFLSYRRFFRPKVMMCTESSEERAICYGDSGGPLLYLRNHRVYQVGISSYSSSKVCGESFDVFTRLDDNYVEWINRRISE